MAGDYWNHNTHYHRLVLSAVPRGCTSALDVGCGDGLLVRRLARRAGHVTGIDSSAEMVSRARELSAGLPNVEYVEADFLDCELEPASHDFVCSVATVHHMDFAAALGRMEAVLRPGGSLIVISLAGNAGAKDLALGAAGVPAHYFQTLRERRRAGNPGAPIADPSMTWDEVRDEARRILPGAVFQRHLLWRYSITWRKPR